MLIFLKYSSLYFILNYYYIFEYPLLYLYNYLIGLLNVILYPLIYLDKNMKCFDNSKTLFLIKAIAFI